MLRIVNVRSAVRWRARPGGERLARPTRVIFLQAVSTWAHLDQESAKMLCSGKYACVKGYLSALPEEHGGADIRAAAGAAYAALDAL